MRHPVLTCAGVMLGVVALASSFAVPMAFAQGKSAPTATITVTCRGTGDLFVDYTYSGFSGAVHGVDFLVDNSGQTIDTVKGGTGEVAQAFNRSLQGSAFNWGAVRAQLVGHTGKVVAGSTSAWNNGNPVTC